MRLLLERRLPFIERDNRSFLRVLFGVTVLELADLLLVVEHLLLQRADIAAAFAPVLAVGADVERIGVHYVVGICDQRRLWVTVGQG